MKKALNSYWLISAVSDHSPSNGLIGENILRHKMFGQVGGAHNIGPPYSPTKHTVKLFWPSNSDWRQLRALR